MFGGLGGALKSVAGKAEEMMENTKQKVGEIAAEKKAAAQAMIEQQAKKTGEIFTSAKGEGLAAATEAQQQAIDGFDAELANAEKAVDSSLTESVEDKPEKKTVSEAEAAPQSSILGGYDKEVESAVEGALQKMSVGIDEKMQEADKYIDEKREEVTNKIQEEATKTGSGVNEGLSSVLGKAKGLLNF